MSKAAIKGITVAISSLVAILVVSVLVVGFGIDDLALSLTMVALISTTFALELSDRLRRRFPVADPDSQTSE